MTHTSPFPACQYHGLRWVYTDSARWPEMVAAGWRRTVRSGWICPTCLAKYPDLQRLAIVQPMRHT